MSLLKDLALTLLVVAVFLIAVEGGLRFAGVRYDSSLYRLDRELGYVLRPGAEGWSVKEREHYERISSQGLRDRVHSLERPAHVIRIAVVGASFAEAKQVDQDAAYWSVLERELNRRLPAGAPRVEVINFGVAGYGLAQEYLVIKDKVWQYDPQIVILSETLHSLVLDSSRKFQTVVGDGPVPYFVRSGSGVVLDDLTVRQQRSFVPLGRWADFLADASNSSRIVSLINATRRSLSADLTALRIRARTTRPAAARQEIDSEDLVLRGPADPDLAEAWQVSEELIRLCQEQVERHHAEFWLFLLDMSPQVDPDPEKRAALEKELGISDLFVFDRLFAQFARQEGIAHETLARKMLAVAERDHVLLHGFRHRPRNSGHWNETGHRVAGRLIADELLNCSKVIRDNAHPPLDVSGQDCNDDSPGNSSPIRLEAREP
ncbi:MAG TPA: SGNH/GDSL hydrolase family protein [Steroidobacteraceae bacterium]